MEQSLFPDKVKVHTSMAMLSIIQPPDIPQDVPADLLRNIEAVGIIQPLLVRLAIAPPYSYVIVDGVRRYAAAKRLGIDVVPTCVVESSPAGEDGLTLIANNQRSANLVCELYAVERLVSKGFSLERIARETFLPLGKIKQLVKLQRLIPEFRKAWEEGRVKTGVARRISSMSQSRQLALLACLGVTGDDWRVRHQDVAEAILASRSAVSVPALDIPMQRIDLVPEVGLFHKRVLAIANPATHAAWNRHFDAMMKLAEKANKETQGGI